MTTTKTTSCCPNCGSEDIVRPSTAPLWCSACEWNLDQWPEPEKGSKRHKRSVLRDRRRAFAANQSLFNELAGVRPERPSRTRAGRLLLCASAGLLIFDLALIVLGGVLLVFDGWPAKVLGAVLVLVGIECRLRFFTVPTGGAISRTDAPTLWSLIDQAGAVLGAPAVDVLLLDNDLNAFCARSGLRRRVVISLGVPLWGALSPAGRQALLGHELGHLVNGDPTTSFTRQPALTTFRRLADVFDPDDLFEDNVNAVVRFAGTIVAYPILFPIHFACRQAHLRLARAAAADHQRAEAYADVLAVRLGGTAGAAELLQVLLFDSSSRPALRRAAASADPADWHAEVAAAVSSRAPDQRVSEQRSMRYRARLFASHPPIGLRARLVRSWPDGEPIVPVPADEMARADRELSRWYKSAQRAIVHGYVG